MQAPGTGTYQGPLYGTICDKRFVKAVLSHGPSATITT